MESRIRGLQNNLEEANVALREAQAHLVEKEKIIAAHKRQYCTLRTSSPPTRTLLLSLNATPPSLCAAVKWSSTIQ